MEVSIEANEDDGDCLLRTFERSLRRMRWGIKDGIEFGQENGSLFFNEVSLNLSRGGKLEFFIAHARHRTKYPEAAGKGEIEGRCVCVCISGWGGICWMTIFFPLSSGVPSRQRTGLNLEGDKMTDNISWMTPLRCIWCCTRSLMVRVTKPGANICFNYLSKGRRFGSWVCLGGNFGTGVGSGNETLWHPLADGKDVGMRMMKK